MKRVSFVFILSVLACSCGASFLEQIQRMEASTDPSYGYTADNPVRIGYEDPIGSIRATHYFLAHLRDSKGDSLEYLGRYSLDDPNYKPSFFSSLPRRFSHNIDPDGILDCYIFRVRGTTDTLNLYFDIYNKGPIKVPSGLVFDKSDL